MDFCEFQATKLEPLFSQRGINSVKENSFPRGAESSFVLKQLSIFSAISIKCRTTLLEGQGVKGLGWLGDGTAGMCYGERCELCRTDEPQTPTPETNDTLCANFKKVVKKSGEPPFAPFSVEGLAFSFSIPVVQKLSKSLIFFLHCQYQVLKIASFSVFSFENVALLIKSCE